jgi:hypothetical protein
MRRADIAPVILLVAFARCWLWDPLFVGAAAAGAVSKALGACLCILLAILLADQLRPLRQVEALVFWSLLFEQSVTAIFAVAYAVAPWPVTQGQGIVSALLGVDLGRISILPMVAAAALLVFRPKST